MSLIRSEISSLQQLPAHWLCEVLEEVKCSDPSSKLCATRRSAGIPFYIQVTKAHFTAGLILKGTVVPISSHDPVQSEPHFVQLLILKTQEDHGVFSACSAYTLVDWLQMHTHTHCALWFTSSVSHTSNYVL